MAGMSTGRRSTALCRLSRNIIKQAAHATQWVPRLRDNGQLRWLLGDHPSRASLGSTSYAATGTAKSGEVRYKPFGVTRYTSGSIPTTYRYTGQREEASLGLYYYGARWYDPALGRFIQPDTIVPDPGEAKAFDRYAYVNNNPLKYNDPTGHCATLENGSPDLDNDAGCWNAADEWFATFGPAGYENAADWRKYFASNASITEDVLRGGLYDYWHPIFQQSGIYHPLYNPPPQMHEGPPPPSLVEAYKQVYLSALLACAKAVSGACGIKGTGAAVGPGFGGQIGVNFYVDQNKAIGLYGVAGLGPAVALEGVAVGASVAMEIIPNGNVFDIEGWGTELEASASYGKGIGVEVAGNIGLDGSSVLSISPQATTGFGAQAHWFITYAYPIYQGK